MSVLPLGSFVSMCSGSLIGTKFSLWKGQGRVLWHSHKTEWSQKGEGFGFGENSMKDINNKATSCGRRGSLKNVGIREPKVRQFLEDSQDTGWGGGSRGKQGGERGSVVEAPGTRLPSGHVALSQVCLFLSPPSPNLYDHPGGP